MNGRNEYEAKIYNKVDGMVKGMPSFVKEWYLSLRSEREATASTCLDYVRKVNRFLESISMNVKGITPDMITQANVSAYFLSCQKKINKDGSVSDTSSSYRQSIRASLYSLFDYMYEQNYIPKNYINKDRMKIKNKDRERVNTSKVRLTQEDFKDIIYSIEDGVGSNKAKLAQAPIKNRDLSIMYVFMVTGMRKQALSEIDIEDLDLREQTLIVVDKGNIIHKYDLPKEVCNILKLWLRDREKFAKSGNNALFITTKGERLSGSAIYKLVDKYADDALGYHISPHKLRHGFCTILFDQGYSPAEVKEIVGHANIETTMRYYDADPKLRQSAANTIMSCIS